MIKEKPKDDSLQLYKGICLFYLGRYAEANTFALEGERLSVVHMANTNRPRHQIAESLAVSSIA
jgi:hypothetical protein